MKKVLFAFIALSLVACTKTAPVKDYPDDNQVRFTANTPSALEVSTKGTSIITSSLTSFSVHAASSWTQVFTKSGSYFTGNRYWPATDPHYRFYALSESFGTVNWTNSTDATFSNVAEDTDLVWATCTSPTYKAVNALSFVHVLTLIKSLTVNAPSGFTLVSWSASLTNLKKYSTFKYTTNAWSGESSAADISIASESASSINKIIWPGTPTFSITYKLQKGAWSQTYTKTATMTALAYNKGYDITANLPEPTGVQEIQFTATVSDWEPASVTVNLN